MELNTDLGKIIIELDIEKAPITVDNFSNIKDFHYDGVIFHRVISGFMIQAGGFTFDLSPKNASRQPIANNLKMVCQILERYQWHALMTQILLKHNFLLII